MKTKIKAKVGRKGLLIPKKLLPGVKEAEIHKENNNVIVKPIDIADPFYQLGTNPVSTGLKDGSVNHDKYLYCE